MANEYEILLDPRLSSFRADDSKLKADLDKIAGKYKIKVGLELSDNAIDNLKKKLPSINLNVSSIDKEIQSAAKAISNKKIDLPINTDNAIKEIEKVKLSVKDVTQMYTELAKIADDTKKLKLSIKGLDESSIEFKKAISLLEKYREMSENLELKINNSGLKNAVKDSKEYLNYLNKTISAEIELSQASEKATEAQQKAMIKNEQTANKNSLALQNLVNRMNKMKVNWSAFTSDTELNSQYNALYNKLKEFQKDGDIYDTHAVQVFRKEIESLANAIGAAGKQHKSFGDSIAETSTRLASYFASLLSITTVVNTLRKMYTAVKEIDTAMTELKKVTDLTDIAYSQFLDRAIDKAQKLGSTVDDVVTATADFARLGYDLESAEALADASITYRNVGDGISDISDASESIISTLKANIKCLYVQKCA